MGTKIRNSNITPGTITSSELADGAVGKSKLGNDVDTYTKDVPPHFQIFAEAGYSNQAWGGTMDINDPIIECNSLVINNGALVTVRQPYLIIRARLSITINATAILNARGGDITLTPPVPLQSPSKTAGGGGGGGSGAANTYYYNGGYGDPGYYKSSGDGVAGDRPWINDGLGNDGDGGIGPINTANPAPDGLPGITGVTNSVSDISKMLMYSQQGILVGGNDGGNGGFGAADDNFNTNPGFPGGLGGLGGGVIILIAPSINIEGIINVNGANGVNGTGDSSTSGAGSGGGGGGGGGCVVMAAQIHQTPTPTINIAGGAGGAGGIFTGTAGYAGDGGVGGAGGNGWTKTYLL